MNLSFEHLEDVTTLSDWYDLLEQVCDSGGVIPVAVWDRALLDREVKKWSKEMEWRKIELWGKVSNSFKENSCVFGMPLEDEITYDDFAPIKLPNKTEVEKGENMGHDAGFWYAPYIPQTILDLSTESNNDIENYDRAMGVIDK